MILIKRKRKHFCCTIKDERNICLNFRNKTINYYTFVLIAVTNFITLFKAQLKSTIELAMFLFKRLFLVD